ncbi:unnamed protein product, partial [marine sediment metagenome]
FVPSKIGNRKLQSKIPLYPAGNDASKDFGYFIVDGKSFMNYDSPIEFFLRPAAY